MILLGLELHGIIKWQDYISSYQQGQADQQPSFQGYHHLAIPISHSLEQLRNPLRAIQMLHTDDAAHIRLSLQHYTSSLGPQKSKGEEEGVGKHRLSSF